jgi:hypothetical protein
MSIKGELSLGSEDSIVKPLHVLQIGEEERQIERVEMVQRTGCTSMGIS